MTTQEEQILEQFEREFNAAVGSLEALTLLAERIEQKIQELKEEYAAKEAEEDMIAPASFTQFLETYFDELRSILIVTTQRAIESSQEYSLPLFAERLLEAVSLPSILQLTIEPSAYSGEEASAPFVIAEVLMDEYAGNIEEWAQAVIAVREELVANSRAPYPPQSSSGEMRSHFFFEKYYAVDRLGKTIEKTYKKGKNKGKTIDITDRYEGKYTETISRRLAYCPSPAPFWSLLEYGNAPYAGGMSSDVGGYAAPEQAPTHFVSEAIALIERDAQYYYESIYYENMKQFSRELKAIDDAINGLYELQNKVLEAIDAFSNDVMDIAETFDGDPKIVDDTINFFYNEVTQRYEKLGKPIESETFREDLNNKMNQLIRGEVKSKEGRITVDGKRIRTKKMISEFKYNLLGKYKGGR